MKWSPTVAEHLRMSTCRACFPVAILAVLVASCAAPARNIPVPAADAVPVSETTRPKNLILMIGDGMGFAQVKSYRYFADDPSTEGIEPLPFDPYLVGAVATDSAPAVCGDDPSITCVRDPYGITESAASATAYATGQDTVEGAISMSVTGEVQTSISETAKRQGKAVGMAVTSQLTHATPAAFLAHVRDRDQHNDIADQIFDNQWNGKPLADVLLGGGAVDFRRKDRDVANDFVEAGYTIVTRRDELLEADATNILGLFAPWGLPRAWDRGADVPSLADMTGAALKALNRDPNGFFLLVEGSQIDWAAHANDAAGVVSEMEDFTAAVRVALEFAAAQGDTLVVITADHETGGMSLGRDDIYRWDPGPLRELERTPAAMTEEFLATSTSLSQVAASSLPFALTEQEQLELDKYAREVPPDPAYGVDGVKAYMAINRLLDERTLTGWSSLGHTGVDVPLYAVGPGSEYFHGVMRNEDVGRQLKALFLQ